MNNDWWYRNCPDDCEPKSLRVSGDGGEIRRASTSPVTPSPASSPTTSSHPLLQYKISNDTLPITVPHRALHIDTVPTSTPGDAVPPVLLSPVLLRPVRSLSAHYSFVRQPAVSDSEPELACMWQRRPRCSRPSDSSSSLHTPPKCISPVVPHSPTSTKLSAFHTGRYGNRSSGSGSLSRSILHRSDSDSCENRHVVLSSVRKGRRRPSGAVGFRSFGLGMHSQTSVESSCSGHNSSGSLVRMRNTSLGHSDPQISASSPSQIVASAPLHFRRDLGQQSVSGTRALACRRSLNASTSPVLMQRCRSPGRSPAVPSCSTAAPSMKTFPIGVPLRSYNTRANSSLMAPAQHSDNRRWSVASLPSSSGYGTPGSNSAFSSECSSQEQLCEMLGDMRMAPRFDSSEYTFTDELQPHTRPRSRSLTSPVKLGSDLSCDVATRNTVYKERFPKAKQQMEDRLCHFIEDNAPLSGSTSAEYGSTSRPVSPHSQAMASLGTSSSFSHRSIGVSVAGQPGVDHALLKLIADGATRFIHHQIVEIASDCLSKSRDDLITCAYFCEMSQRLEETLNEAREKTSVDGFAYLSKLVRSLLMIVSRPARLLECLEFDPDEFYRLLEEAEGAVREQLGSGTARVPDLPQYIISKLGLDRDPLIETDAEVLENDSTTLMNFSFDGAPPSNDVRPKWPTPESRPPCEEDFETIRLISNGAYGAVYLVRHRETRQRFALKRMNKHTLIMRNQVDQVYAERDILTFTDNPFVVSFYGSFETRHHLCMLMEYVEGGDCAALLKNAGTLPIDVARLYIAETVLAIDYLHSYGIVHRDLKPDNLLITAMGHIKLTDFGLSKIGLMNRTTLVCEGYLDVSDTQQFKDKQLCGTPEYIAPEVILRQDYGKPVDWWALGVILYEFLIGIVPFIGDSPEQLFANIISEEVEFPEGDEALPAEAETLITQLLEKLPVERLGTVGGAQQVMVQPFFNGLDFKSLLRQKAEFVPQLESEEDTSYFDTRSDRYNHDAESGDEETVPMFGSFSTASPRHSIVGLDPSAIPAAHSVVPTSSASEEGYRRCRADSESLMQLHSIDSFEGQQFDPKYECPIPSAVLLRRRFSAQRQSNLSTSSSGTTGTGCMNTACSSTDSSMDASAFASEPPRRSPLPVDTPRRSPLPSDPPRRSPQPPDAPRRTTSTPSPLPRFAISCEPDDGTTVSGDKKELSPVDESRPCDTTADSSENEENRGVGSGLGARVVLRGGGVARVAPSGSLQLVIPSTASHTTQHSPGGSVSSTSSFDGSSPNPSLNLSSSVPESSTSPQISSSLKPPIVIRKGPKGYGFTIRSVRVYLGEHSDYYTIEHLVTEVDEASPAFEAGLRPCDLITHVHSQPVSNLTHPQLMHRLLAFGNELSLKVTPMSSTSIREGAARRSIGKLAKKKPKRPQRRVPLEKKSRKPSSLLRRLSGKRANNDIVPGSSSQKQTFMPRSVSSQDGIQLSTAGTTSTASVMSTSPISVTSQLKRLSDVGIASEEMCSASCTSPLAMPSTSRPSTLQGLKHKVAGMAHQLTTRKHAITSQMPVSPLARHEVVPVSSRSPSPTNRTKRHSLIKMSK